MAGLQKDLMARTLQKMLRELAENFTPAQIKKMTIQEVRKFYGRPDPPISKLKR